MLPVGLTGIARAQHSLLPNTIDAGAKVVIGDPLTEATESPNSLEFPTSRGGTVPPDAREGIEYRRST